MRTISSEKLTSAKRVLSVNRSCMLVCNFTIALFNFPISSLRSDAVTSVISPNDNFWIFSTDTSRSVTTFFLIKNIDMEYVKTMVNNDSIMAVNLRDDKLEFICAREYRMLSIASGSPVALPWQLLHFSSANIGSICLIHGWFLNVSSIDLAVFVLKTDSSSASSLTSEPLRILSVGVILSSNKLSVPLTFSM